MNNEQTTIDFTYARTPLFVRQTIAVTFGIPIDQEFTWRILRERICDPGNSSVPKRLLVRGFSSLAVALPEEASMLRTVLKDLCTLRPDVEIQFVLHD